MNMSSELTEGTGSPNFTATGAPGAAGAAPPPATLPLLAAGAAVAPPLGPLAVAPPALPEALGAAPLGFWGAPGALAPPPPPQPTSSAPTSTTGAIQCGVLRTILASWHAASLLLGARRGPPRAPPLRSGAGRYTTAQGSLAAARRQPARHYLCEQPVSVPPVPVSGSVSGPLYSRAASTHACAPRTALVQRARGALCLPW